MAKILLALLGTLCSMSFFASGNVQAPFPPLPNLFPSGRVLPTISTPDFSFPQVPSLPTYPGSAESPSERALMTEIMDPWRAEIGRDIFDTTPKESVSDDPNDMGFYLYTNPSDRYDFKVLDFNNEASLVNAGWIPNAPYKFLMHGFTQNGLNSSMPTMIKDAYLNRMQNGIDKYNIICVDWGRLAHALSSTLLPMYTAAVRNVKVAGDRVGELVVKLANLKVIKDLDQVHLIGFSLGAHVAGFAGNKVIQLTGTAAGRCTGLDPAGPFFYMKIPGITSRPMRNNDCKVVDVMHTSWNSYGIGDDIANADFHPNFNLVPLPPWPLPVQLQPECLKVWGTLKPFQVCSHNMAPVYYAMSILTDLTGCECFGQLAYLGKCGKMCSQKGTLGERWNPSQIGLYYMDIPRRLLLEPASGRLAQGRKYMNEDTSRIHEFDNSPDSHDSDEDNASQSELPSYYDMNSHDSDVQGRRTSPYRRDPNDNNIRRSG